MTDVAKPEGIFPVFISVPFASSFSVVDTSVHISGYASPPRLVVMLHVFSVAHNDLSMPVYKYTSTEVTMRTPY